MLEIALQITLCLLIAALIGFILGFIVAKATNKKTDTKKVGDKKSTKKKNKNKVKVPNVEKTIEDEIETLIETVTEETEEVEIPTAEVTLKAVEALKELDTTKEAISEAPELLNAPKDNQKDTLTQIKGIGPKVEEQLNAAGIYHFEQIANWSEANIQWLEVNTTFAHRAKKDLWVNQAKSLI
jgi:predicted flap endonuclease-1-like 5' DNA nuclease